MIFIQFFEAGSHRNQYVLVNLSAFLCPFGDGIVMSICKYQLQSEVGRSVMVSRTSHQRLSKSGLAHAYAA
jgi:hypothetical protein